MQAGGEQLGTLMVAPAGGEAGAGEGHTGAGGHVHAGTGKRGQ